MHVLFLLIILKNTLQIRVNGDLLKLIGLLRKKIYRVVLEPRKEDDFHGFLTFGISSLDMIACFWITFPFFLWSGHPKRTPKILDSVQYKF